MLQTAHEFTFKCTVLVRMSPVTMLPPIEPVSYVAISIGRLPYSIAILSTLLPFSFETLAIQPLIPSFPLSQAILKEPEVLSINILFTSFDFLIVFKKTLIYGSCCHQNTLSIFNPQLRNAEIHPILVWYYLKMLFLDELLQVEGRINWSVGLDEIFVLLPCWNMELIAIDTYIRTCLLIIIKSLAKLCF